MCVWVGGGAGGGGGLCPCVGDVASSDTSRRDRDKRCFLKPYEHAWSDPFSGLPSST